MAYERSQMLYNDGTYYKWTAQADKDNRYYTAGADHSELNRTEGYEVLYFINHLVNTKWPANVTLSTYQKIERMIRMAPGVSKTHKKIEDWILANWSKY